MWDELVAALTTELSDLADAQDIASVLVRLPLAALLGSVLGYERERRGKAAGLRTHMLVAIGAALFMLAPQISGVPVSDMSRVIQGVVAGVGFLGAGAIIWRPSEEQVEGLTTAAGIWMTAAIGIACGLGSETVAVLATLLALLILAMTPHVASRQ